MKKCIFIYAALLSLFQFNAMSAASVDSTKPGMEEGEFNFSRYPSVSLFRGAK